MIPKIKRQRRNGSPYLDRLQNGKKEFRVGSNEERMAWLQAGLRYGYLITSRKQPGGFYNIYCQGKIK